jgi:hypothetical protein
MKVIRILGLGFVVWGLGLLWPEVNQVLTPWAMMGATLGLGGLLLAYILVQRLDHHRHDNGAGQDHPSRPMPMAATR